MESINEEQFENQTDQLLDENLSLEQEEFIPEPVDPVTSGNRIHMLDELRGFALMGILIMNIQNFGLFEAGYFNPYYLGKPDALNAFSYNFTHLFADMKMMTLFSMLFGAGMMLFIEKALKKTGSSTGLHYKRMGWLLVFGLIHAYLIWQGDILVPYAIGGMIVYTMRNLSAGWLLGLGLFFMTFTGLGFLSIGLFEDFIPSEEIDKMRIEMWEPDATLQQKETAAFTGGYTDQLNRRIAFNSKYYGGLLFFIWRIIGNMLLGMALFKWGIMIGQRSQKFYRNFMIGFLGLGFGMIIIGLILRYNRDFEFVFSFSYGYNLNYWGSVAVALGYIGIFGLWTRSEFGAGIRKRIAAMGRMAFTNYIMQSVLCSLIFYGIGLTLFEKLERYQLNFVVLGIWILQLYISPIWLKHYRFGPLEWLWRTLTYGKAQPMRRQVTADS